MHDHLSLQWCLWIAFSFIKASDLGKNSPQFFCYRRIMLFELLLFAYLSFMAFFRGERNAYFACLICHKMWLLASGHVYLSLCRSVLWIVFGRDSKSQKSMCLSLRICLQRHRWKRRHRQKSLQKLRKRRRWAAKQSLESHHCSHLERHPLRRHSLD